MNTKMNIVILGFFFAFFISCKEKTSGEIIKNTTNLANPQSSPSIDENKEADITAVKDPEERGDVETGLLCPQGSIRKYREVKECERVTMADDEYESSDDDLNDNNTNFGNGRFRIKGREKFKGPGYKSKERFRIRGKKNGRVKGRMAFKEKIRVPGPGRNIKHKGRIKFSGMNAGNFISPSNSNSNCDNQSAREEVRCEWISIPYCEEVKKDPTTPYPYTTSTVITNSTLTPTTTPTTLTTTPTTTTTVIATPTPTATVITAPTTTVTTEPTLTVTTTPDPKIIHDRNPESVHVTPTPNTNTTRPK